MRKFQWILTTMIHPHQEGQPSSAEAVNQSRIWNFNAAVLTPSHFYHLLHHVTKSLQHCEGFIPCSTDQSPKHCTCQMWLSRTRVWGGGIHDEIWSVGSTHGKWDRARTIAALNNARHTVAGSRSIQQPTAHRVWHTEPLHWSVSLMAHWTEGQGIPWLLGQSLIVHLIGNTSENWAINSFECARGRGVPCLETRVIRDLERGKKGRRDHVAVSH